MTTTMAALSSPSIIQAEFIRLITSTTTYYFCNAAAAITVDGMTFSNLGSLLSISAIDRSIKANSADLAISVLANSFLNGTQALFPIVQSQKILTINCGHA